MILKEESEIRIPIAITNILIALIKRRFKDHVYLAQLRDITELFKKYVDTHDIKIYLSFNLRSIKREVNVFKTDKSIFITIKDDYFDKNNNFQEEDLFKAISHEVIHSLDYLKGKNKTKYSSKNLNNEKLKKTENYSRTYFNDIYEFNVLIQKIKIEYKMNKEFRKYFNEIKKDYKKLNELLQYLELGKFIPKYFINDEDFKKRLYKRLVREKLI